MSEVMMRLMPIAVRLLSIVEPLTPRAVSYILGRYLKDWRNTHLILDYKVRTRRLGKFNYKVFVDLYLTPKQANKILKEKIFQTFKRR